MIKIIDGLNKFKTSSLRAKPLEMGLLVALVVVTAAAGLDVVRGDHTEDLMLQAGAIGSHADLALSVTPVISNRAGL
jgi:hypothetical protein